jgi:MATE family multidrug resistance protein
MTATIRNSASSKDEWRHDKTTPTLTPLLTAATSSSSATSSSDNHNHNNSTHVASRARRSSVVHWHAVVQESTALLNLMIPTAIIQLGFTVCPFLTASYVGRTFGSVYLDGFTLAYLTGNLTTLSVLQGLFSASDTLSPQAFGAGNHAQVGLLAIRGFVGSMVLVLPINILLAVMLQPLLTWIGEDPEASRYAAQWYRIYILYLPFYALYAVTWKFLSAQHIMRPLVVVCFLSTCVVLPLCLQYWTAWFGFLGSAMAVVAFQTAQAVLLLLYLKIFQPHAPTTWPSAGFLRHHWKEALEWNAFKRYMILGMGGILMSCEWIYWETLSLMIGTLGVVPLSVHTVPTQCMTVCFMIPLGCGIALAIRMGHTLPAFHGGVRQAQILAASTFGVCAVVFGVVAVCMYHWRYGIYRIFLNPQLEPAVWKGCDQIWHYVVFFYFNLSMFGINLGIATGLGMQWTLGLVTVVFLWILGFPAAWYAATTKMKEMVQTHPDTDGTEALVAAWQWINPPYVAINVVLVICFVSVDWYHIRDTIRIREGMVDLFSDDDDDENEEENRNGSNNKESGVSAYGSV